MGSAAPPTQSQKTCVREIAPGKFCRRKISDRERFCWQHAHGVWHKVRALPRNQKIVFWMTLVALFIGGLGAYWSYLGARKPGQPFGPPSGANSNPSGSPNGQVPPVATPAPQPDAGVEPPSVTIKSIERPTRLEVGKDNPLELNVEVHGKSGFDVYMYRAAGPWPFYTDSNHETQVQERMWNAFMKSWKRGKPFHVPANNESLALPSYPMPLTVEGFEAIKSNTAHWYYLFHLVDTKNRTLLDFCAHVGSDLQFTYCRFHNGP